MDARRIVAAFGCLLVIESVPARGGDSQGGRPTPPPVAWKELQFAAHKAGISATIDLRLDRQTVGSTDDVVLESTTHLPGRTFVARERVNASTAVAREIVDTETGIKHHRKTYTLAARGFRFELVEPAGLSELLQPPERWTKRDVTFAAFPRALPAGAPVTGPAGLLYAASGASLDYPGDAMTIHVLVQTHLERVTVSVVGSEPVDLVFDESAGGRLRTVHEQLHAVRLLAHSEPVDPGSQSAFRLFGLDGDVQLLWDPVRRLPVEISGHVKMVGQVEVRLVSATMP